MHPKVQKAFEEGRLRFFNNGGYSYKPSKEYVTRFGKRETNSPIKVFRDSITKLDNLDKAFEIAERKHKKVSHVSNGRIILV